MNPKSELLMLSRRFAPLFWTQFFSAFNDNFLKNSLVFLILYRLGGENSEALITLAGAVFIAPYFFLSAIGGEIADRFDKAMIAQRLKFVEIAVAAIAVAGFVLHSIVILFIALFGFGVIGALFGPIKYGILPDHLERSELPKGNALVEGATFIAILLGTIVGGIAAKGGGDPAIFSGLVMAFAVLCWLCSLFIPPTGEGAPHLVISKNIAASTWSLIQHLRSDPRLWWGALVTSWFWLVGVVVLSLLPTMVKELLGGNELVGTYLSCDLLHRGGRRFGSCSVAGERPHRAAADPDRCCSARRLCAVSRLCHLWRHAACGICPARETVFQPRAASMSRSR